MSPKTLRIIGAVCCGMAAVIGVLNLQRTANLGLKVVPLILIIVGARQFVRARKLEQQQ